MAYYYWKNDGDKKFHGPTDKATAIADGQATKKDFSVFIREIGVDKKTRWVLVGWAISTNNMEFYGC
jgi:hypothetical protein